MANLNKDDIINMLLNAVRDIAERSPTNSLEGMEDHIESIRGIAGAARFSAEGALANLGATTATGEDAAVSPATHAMLQFKQRLEASIETIDTQLLALKSNFLAEGLRIKTPINAPVEDIVNQARCVTSHLDSEASTSCPALRRDMRKLRDMLYFRPAA